MAEIPKSYEPQGVEQQWYDRWVAAGCFKGKVDHTRESFAVMIPPPNVTGVLHMGHLLNNTLQDIMVRRARQEGKSALWLPGTDHAGIATQSRVEKELRQKEGKTRHDLGREKFIQVASEWRDKHGGIILGQLRKLGASCDWDRTVHTLDAGYSQAVLQTFVTLYERGYVYRGKRMVNWCPVSQTGLSDEEVIMKPSKGSLYRMRYEVAEIPGTYLEISTTRPETIPGDAAVAVHPDDERYKHLIGKHVWRPFPRAQIPIVGDTAVEKEFGTGVLKVTPAHDRTDFDIGKRHNLPVVDVMNPDGTMNADAGPLAGVERFKARGMAEKLLEELGALVKTEPYENTVGYSERAAPQRTVVHPLPEDRRSQARRHLRHHQVPPRTLDQDLPPLAGKHPGLVRQPPALVGPPHSGLVPQRRRPQRPEEPACLPHGPRRRRQLGTGSRRARHVGFLLALVPRDDWLAQAR
jgi:valyl-tRNA synthetase